MIENEIKPSHLDSNRSSSSSLMQCKIQRRKTVEQTLWNWHDDREYNEQLIEVNSQLPIAAYNEIKISENK